MALTKEEFMAALGLTESQEEDEFSLQNQDGAFVCYVCQECGKVQASAATLKAGELQPEYCKCWHFDMG